MVGRERTLVPELYEWRQLVSSLLQLISALLLLDLHSLAPCILAVCFLMNQCIGAHDTSSPPVSPLLKTTTVLLMITSLLLIFLTLLEVLLLCLPLLWLCRLLWLPLTRGGRRWRACIIAIVASRYLLQLYVRLGWRLPLHSVYCWASWSH